MFRASGAGFGCEVDFDLKHLHGRSLSRKNGSSSKSEPRVLISGLSCLFCAPALRPSCQANFGYLGSFPGARGCANSKASQWQRHLRMRCNRLLSVRRRSAGPPIARGCSSDRRWSRSDARRPQPVPQQSPSRWATPILSWAPEATTTHAPPPTSRSECSA